MKSLLVVLSLIGSAAFAEMKPMGTFVAYQCGVGPSGSVCFGHKIGVEGSYMSVAVQRAAYVVYKIVKKTPINGGINPKASAVVYDLVADNTYSRKTARATVRSMGGKTTSASVNLGNGVVVSVGNFEYTVTTM